MFPSIRALLLSALLCFLNFSSTFAHQLHVTKGTDGAGNPQITLGIDPTEGFTYVPLSSRYFKHARKGNSSRKRVFSIMIATYQRDLLLPPLIKHLTSTPPPSLRQILIIWQNTDSPVPDFLSPKALEEYSTSGVVVSVRKSWKNSMNERFRPILDWGEEIQTDSVMIMDDDIVLRREALEWGYQEFVAANKYGPGRIVGFTGRDFEQMGENEWQYFTKPTKSYSMVLSNAAFFKKEWLKKYWEHSEEMSSLRSYVDSGEFFVLLSILSFSQAESKGINSPVFNCDDILVNYLVSNLTGSPPLLLQPSTPLRTVPTEGGLWNRVTPSANAPETIITSPPRPEHFSTRKECLAHYFNHFARFAPPSSPNTSHYPLIKTKTSVSQDVEDHSRWMFDNELWETPTWTQTTEDASAGDILGEEVVEELSKEEEEMLEKGDYESFLEGLSDEEVDELMQSLEEMVGEGAGEEESAVADGESPVEERKSHGHEEL